MGCYQHGGGAATQFQLGGDAVCHAHCRANEQAAHDNDDEHRHRPFTYRRCQIDRGAEAQPLCHHHAGVGGVIVQAAQQPHIVLVGQCGGPFGQPLLGAAQAQFHPQGAAHQQDQKGQ